MNTPIVRAALVDGLVESLGSLNCAVFPAEPAEQFEQRGSAWISDTQTEFEVRALGHGPWNQKESIETTISFGAYCEAPAAVTAAADAEARVGELLGAFVTWLLAHQDLNNTCSQSTLGKVAWTRSPAASGWAAQADLTVNAECHPPFTS